MGMQVGGATGGVKNDINVTPLIDVVLVLVVVGRDVDELVELDVDELVELDVLEVDVVPATVLVVVGREVEVEVEVVDDGRGGDQALERGRRGRVADDVEPRLQPRPRARDDVVAHLVGVPARVDVGEGEQGDSDLAVGSHGVTSEWALGSRL